MDVMTEQEIMDSLRVLEKDPLFVTESAYRVNIDLWPENRISFVDTHLTYLKSHPNQNPRYYLSNLRLKLRKRVNR